MTKGAYLYYGFKISEKEMVEKFFTQEFKRYVRDMVKTFMYKEYENEIFKHIDMNTPLESNGKLNRVYKSLFREYYDYDGAFIDVSESRYSIELIHAPCCMYYENTYWIIGIRLAKLPAYSLKKIKFHQLCVDEIQCLKQIQEKYDIDPDNLGYYDMPMDCSSCT